MAAIRRARATCLIGNHGEPCRFCRKPFVVRVERLAAIRLAMPDEYGGQPLQDVADDLDICPTCAPSTPSVPTEER